MRNASARLLLGATLLVAGFGVLSDGSPVRNALVQSMAGALDMKDRQCRSVAAAQGSLCPAGCEARPLRSPEDRSAPTECHSRLWVATCGKACDPAPGFIRLKDGSLADATRLSVTLAQAPDAALEAALSGMHVALTPRFDGLYRFDAVLKDGVSDKTKAKLAALHGIASVDYIAK